MSFLQATATCSKNCVFSAAVKPPKFNAIIYVTTEETHTERYSTTVTRSPERPGLSQLASATQHHTRETQHGIEKHQTRWSLTAAGYQNRMPLNSETFRYETASDLICYQHLEEQEDKTSGKHQRGSGKRSSALQFNVQTKQKQH